MLLCPGDRDRKGFQQALHWVEECDEKAAFVVSRKVERRVQRWNVERVGNKEPGVTLVTTRLQIGGLWTIKGESWEAFRELGMPQSGSEPKFKLRTGPKFSPRFSGGAEPDQSGSAFGKRHKIQEPSLNPVRTVFVNFW
jgi:hypothetical protein